MKNKFLLIITFALVFSCSSDNNDSTPEINTNPCIENSDSLYQGDVILETQADVDFFGALCYEGINGDLIIGNSLNNDINSLLPSSCIKKVNNLSIEDTSLSCLEGINLTNQTFLNRLFISENENLITVGNINIPTNVGELSIFQNNTLINFSGFNNVEHIGNLVLQFNSGLINFVGLDSLTNCSALFVYENTSLINFEGLENLTNITGVNQIGLDVKFNPNLISFSGLDNLVYSDLLVIENNISLNDYCGLNNLVLNGTIEFNNFSTNGCEYNPTLEDMHNGNCNQ
ncbi:hypothetical protein [Lacinutrix jangbogonensis]|uniref:hypothetical protein n=1 Tax=Lacinutrix jangbogonensis TaxID=1469557 RepID=UPI00053DBE59|nr:hypothetical protein [Lacinutrix jangbogonensis]